jgi:hypothetical protein
MSLQTRDTRLAQCLVALLNLRVEAMKKIPNLDEKAIRELLEICRRQFKIDHLCQLNFDQGSKAGCLAPGCG